MGDSVEEDGPVVQRKRLPVSHITLCGDGRSLDVLRQKFGKLKKHIESEFPDSNDATSRKRTRPAAETASSKASGRNKDTKESDDEDDRKRAKTEQPAALKQEAYLSEIGGGFGNYDEGYQGCGF